MTRNPKLSLSQSLQKQIEIFKFQATATRANPTEENVHQLRVNVRRIRAVLWLAHHSSPSISFERLPLRLRKLGQALGHQRELDVARSDAKKYHIKTKKIRALRRCTQDHLMRKISAESCKKILSQLEKAISRIEKHPEINIKPGLKALRKEFYPWKKKDFFPNKELHRFRIIVKKTRYALEAVGQEIQPLKKIQNLLGQGHDLEVLQALSKKNKKIQIDVDLRYAKARKIIKPTLCFILEKLDGRDQ
jgi:CHAD domain-containing protein